MEGKRYKTVIHGDFKAANIMYSRIGSEMYTRGKGSEDVSCAVYDFQWVGGGQ